MQKLRTSSKRFQNLPIKTAGFYLFLKYVNDRIRKYQFNWNMIVTGDTGSGKTWFAIYLAWKLNPKRFNADFYTNSVAEFLDIVENKSKKGDTIVMDETGANLSAREWHSVGNILAGQALQTYRNKNLAVFFCTPDPSFTDVQLRRLINCQAVMQRFDLKYSYVDLRRIKVDRTNQKIRPFQFKMRWQGRQYRIRRIRLERSALNCIPKKIMNGIDEKDKRFKDAVLKKAKFQAEIIEQSRLGITKSVFEIAEQVEENREKYNHRDSRYPDKIDWHLIAADFKLSRDKASMVVSLIERNKL